MKSLIRARDGTPQVVNDAQHGVAILYGFCDHAHGVQVVDLLDRDVLALQFLVDAVQPLDAALDRGGDSSFL